MKVMRHIIKLFLLVVFCVNTVAHSATDSKGTNFMIGFPLNSIGGALLTLHITSDTDAQGTVEIPGLTFVQPFSVAANDIIRVDIPGSVQWMTGGTVSNRGIHVISDNEVTVYGLSRVTQSTDAFMALPVDTLGLEYITMSYDAFVSYGQPSQILVVGVYDSTEISITPSANANGHVAGVPFNVTLNSGETYYLSSLGDLTGSVVTASSPVSVLSGVQCANVPTGYIACDHIIEMMPPVATWGKSFLTVPLATRLKGDFFRILASRDNSTVTINGTDVAVLNRGEYYEGFLTQQSQITSNEPVLVAQYSVGQSYDGVISDPFMMLVPPTEQFLNSYGFTTLGPDVGFSNSFVNIVASTAEVGTIILDGAPIDITLFTPIGTSGFSGAQVPVGPGSHSINSLTPFGIYVYGFGSYDSYGYPGGMAFELINPQGDIYPPNVKLVRMDGVIQGIAEDSEDLNINGVLDAGEDLNANGVIDPRSEDINGNGLLDAGEDLNANGILDHDTGIFKIELEPGSVNLQVQYNQFVPGSTQASFTVSRIDISIPGQGVLAVLDGVGNKVTRDIEIIDEDVLTSVRVVSTLSTDRIDLDATAFTIPPFSTDTIDGKTLIEWRFDRFNIGQVEDIGFDVFLRDPVPGETRLVTHSLDLYYIDINGNEVHSGLGSQVIEVLSSIHTVNTHTDRNQYTVDENVLINTSVSSLSDFNSTTTVRLSIKDGTGALVSELGVYLNTAIAANSTITMPALQFFTNSYYEGMYTVHAELLDGNNNVYALATAPFIINAPSDIKVAATVSTDKPTYSPYETVNILDRIRNIVPNVNLENMTATTTVFGPGGLSFWSQTTALPQLLPDSLKDLHYSVLLGRALAGTYRVLLVVKDDQGVERALSEKTFIVQSTAEIGAGLFGTIAVTPWTVLKSENLNIVANLNNLGNANLENLPVTVSIIDPENAQIIKQWTKTVATLAIQSNDITTHDWQAIGSVGAAYLAVLSVEIGSKIKPLAQETFIIGKKFNAQMTVGDKGRLLVWLSDVQYSHESGGHMMGNMWNDPSTTVTPTLTEQQAYVTSRLQEAGWQQFTIVTNKTDFTRELHQGGYTLYALLGGYIPLNKELERELTEAVYRGEGLLVVADVHEELDDALGVDEEEYHYATAINLLASPLHTGGLVAFSDVIRVLTARLDGAEVVGNFLLLKHRDKDTEHEHHYASEYHGDIAATRYAYGDGRSVFIGFNLVTEAMATGTTANDFNTLLINALNDVHPETLIYSEGLAVPITLSLSNLGVATPGQVVINLPSGSKVIHPGLAQQPDASTLVWPFTLADKAADGFTFWLQLPHDQNPVTLTASVQSGVAPDYIDHTPAVLSLNVLLATTLDDIINQLSQLAGLNYYYDQALIYLQAAQIAIGTGDLQLAHLKMLEAAEYLGNVPLAEAASLRTQLDWLIRDMAFEL